MASVTESDERTNHVQDPSRTSGTPELIRDDSSTGRINRRTLVFWALGGVLAGCLSFEHGFWPECALLAAGLAVAVVHTAGFMMRRTPARGTSDVRLARYLLFAVCSVAALAGCRLIGAQAAKRACEPIISAIERYRAVHQSFPRTLAELEPPHGENRFARYDVDYAAERDTFSLTIRLPWTDFNQAPTYDGSEKAWIH